MPGSRITLRLSDDLLALVSAHVREGESLSDVIREALATQFGEPQTARQTARQTQVPPDGAADMVFEVVSARVSDAFAGLSAIASDVSDIRQRLEALEGRVEVLSARVSEDAVSRQTQPRAEKPQRQTSRQTGEPQEQEAPPVPTGRPRIASAQLQAIATAYGHCAGLTLRAFGQYLFDQGIYRGRARDGREVPADHSRLRRWLARAREAGLLADTTGA